MPLIHRSLHLTLPNTPLYSTEHALETFVGENVMAFQQHFHWFWFSRYGGIGAWEVKFRFSTNNFPGALEAHYNHLVDSFAHGADGCGDYDYVHDLGGQRFIGQDAANADQAIRAGIVYDLLTAGARLLLASLVQEPNGVWRHEHETQSHYNRDTSLETIHHLFCNMTGVPTWAAVLYYPHFDQKYRVVSDLESRQIIGQDQQIQLVGLHRIQH